MTKKIILQSILFLLLCSISFSSYAQGLQNALKTAYEIKADSLLEYLFNNNKLMGSVTIAKAGKVVYEKATGYSQLSGNEKIFSSTGTKYRIGSITKMFTSVMIFQLKDEKKLSINSTLSKFFPGIPNADKITIENLLNHHSGLHNFTNDSTYLNWDTSPKTEQQMLELFKNQKPDFQPGEKREYSNTNYVVLGFIIEKITGDNYRDELKKRIVDKIGLENTYYGHRIDANNNEAFSYTFGDNMWAQSKETDMSIPGGAGAIVSTPGDLTKFIYALFTEKLISPESLKEMTTIKDNFGMGIFQISFYDKHGSGHTGGIDGFVSNLEYFPGDSIALAFCANGMNYNMNETLKGILSSYYDKPFTFPSFKTINIPVKQLSKYEGVFSSVVLNLKISIKRKGNILTAQAANQSAFPLSAVSETQFIFDPAGITIDFTISKDGQINEFYLKQRSGRFLFTKEK
ncbi:MAG: serine hydrolase domain-containing protein [Ignavibacteriaceae bacterium]